MEQPRLSHPLFFHNELLSPTTPSLTIQLSLFNSLACFLVVLSSLEEEWVCPASIAARRVMNWSSKPSYNPHTVLKLPNFNNNPVKDLRITAWMDRFLRARKIPRVVGIFTLDGNLHKVKPLASLPPSPLMKVFLAHNTASLKLLPSFWTQRYYYHFLVITHRIYLKIISTHIPLALSTTSLDVGVTPRHKF